MSHPCDAELVELAVATDARERDAVVDLADLVQGVRRVFRADEDAVVVSETSQRSPASDALARVVGTVLHHLLRRDVERHTHRRAPRTSCSLTMALLSHPHP